MDFEDIQVESLKKPQPTDLAQRARAVKYMNKPPVMPVKDAGKIQHTDSHLKARMQGYWKRFNNFLRGLEQAEEYAKNQNVTKASELVGRYN